MSVIGLSLRAKRFLFWRGNLLHFKDGPQIKVGLTKRLDCHATLAMTVQMYAV